MAYQPIETLDSDKSYQQLKKEVSSKQFTVDLFNTASVLVTLGAVVGLALSLGFGGIVLAGTATATNGLIASGVAFVASLGMDLFNSKRTTELALDYEELEIKRKSNYLEKVVGKSNQPVQAIAMAEHLSSGKGESYWRDMVAADAASPERLR